MLISKEPVVHPTYVFIQDKICLPVSKLNFFIIVGNLLLTLFYYEVILTCCATTDSTSKSIRLNSSKQHQDPDWARPEKNLPSI